MKKSDQSFSRQPSQSSPPPGRDTFLIFMVVGCGIMAVLSFNFGPGKEPKPQVAQVTREQGPAISPPKKTAEPVSITDVPLATGDEPIDKLFVQSGCAVCHTIPGILPAKGREGPKLVLGTTAPLRLADANYQGTATTVREYIQESILNPGAYVVSGFPDRVMPRWYGTRLNAKALDRIITYLEPITE
jgi:mono/diheme cytochrome c family protein